MTTTDKNPTRACPVCGNDKNRFVRYVYDTLLPSDTVRWNTVQCTECSLVYLDPPPTREQWLAFSGNPASYYRSSERDIRSCLRRIRDYPAGRILDIGCGQGEFLNRARRQGWDILGIEVSEQVPNPFSIPMRYGEFHAMELPKDYFDVVTFWGVTEYLSEPLKFFGKAKEVLKADGRMLFVTGNYRSIQRRFMNVHNFPRQQLIWSVPALEALFDKVGLRIVRMDFRNDIRNGRCTELVTFLFKRYVLGKSWDMILREHNAPKTSVPATLVPVKILDRAVTLPLSALVGLFGFNGVINIEVSKR